MKLGFFNLIYQHEVTVYQTLYSKDGTVTQATATPKNFNDILSCNDTVYVMDGIGAWLCKAMTFIFISPNPKGYKKLWKEHGTKMFYSKVWNKSKILVAHQLLYKNIDESLVFQLYEKWGGVPRHVLQKGKDSSWHIELDAAIKAIKSDNWLDSMTKVAGKGGSAVANVISHYMMQDYIQKTMVFINCNISEFVYTALEKGAWMRTANFLETEHLTLAGFRGQLFV